MEIKVLKNEGKELIIEFESSDLTFPDLLAHELMNDSDVTFAGVSKDHPEVGKPTLVIRTNRKSASAALDGAMDRIGDNVKELKSGVSRKR